MSVKYIASRVVAENPEAVSDFRDDEDRASSFLVDEVMRRTHGVYGEYIVNEAIISEIL